MPEPRDCDLIIRDGLVITMDAARTVWQRGDIAIIGNTIAAVGASTEMRAAWRGRRVLDARGAAVHPGFVDAHYHIPNHLTRGIFPEAATSADYFVSYAPWYDRMDDEDEHAAGLCAGLEMLRSGVTCFMEPGTSFATAAVAAAAEAVAFAPRCASRSCSTPATTTRCRACSACTPTPTPACGPWGRSRGATGTTRRWCAAMSACSAAARLPTR